MPRLGRPQQFQVFKKKPIPIFEHSLADAKPCRKAFGKYTISQTFLFIDHVSSCFPKVDCSSSFLSLPPPFSEWLQLFLVLSYTLLMSYVKEVIGYWTGTLITTTLITLKRLSFVWVCSVCTIWHFNEDGGGGRSEGGERSIGTDSSCERCSLKFRSFQSSLAYKKREKSSP